MGYRDFKKKDYTKFLAPADFTGAVFAHVLLVLVNENKLKIDNSMIALKQQLLDVIYVFYALHMVISVASKCVKLALRAFWLTSPSQDIHQASRGYDGDYK